MSTDKSPAEIEREIEAERSALARSLEELQAQFAPERIMNQITGYARDNGGEIANGLVEQVKRNPVAAALAGVGVAWLIAGARKPSYARHDAYASRHGYDGDEREFATRRDLRPTSDDWGSSEPSPAWDDRTYPKAPGLAETSDPMAGYEARLAAASGDTSDGPSMGERVGDVAAGIADGSRAAAARAKAGASDVWSSTKDGASNAWSSAKDGASDAWSSTKDGAHDAWDGTRRGASAGWDGATDGAGAAWDGTRDGASAAWDGARDGASAAWTGGADATRAGYESARDGWSGMSGAAAERYGAMRDSTSRAFQDWQGSARGRYMTAKAKAQGYRARAYAKSADLHARMSEGTESLSEQARLRVMRARHAAYEAQRTMERKMGEAADKTGRAYDSQPLIFGGLAIAAGALLGLGLPRTEQENRAFGAYRDHLFDEAEHIFEEESRKARAVAEAALAEAKSVARETADGVKASAQGAVDDIKAHAKGAVDDAKARASSAIDAAKADAKSAMADAKADAKTAVADVKSSADAAKDGVPTGKDAVDAAEAKAKGAAQRIADAARDEAKKQDLGGSIRS